MEVNIRPLVESDAYTSVHWRNDPEVFKYTGNTYNHIITIDSELEWIKKVIANPNDYRCAIIAEGKYVGNIYLTDIEGGKATYHIFIGDKEYWGKGVAYKASKKIIEYGFQHLHLDEVVLKVRRENNRAYTLYKRLGFQEFDSDGNWCSMRLQKRSSDDL